MNTCLADFEARDYLAFREVIHFCYRRNCYFAQDASTVRVVSKDTGHKWAEVESDLSAHSGLDTPHIALLRVLVENLKHDSCVEDSLKTDLRVSDLVGRSAL